MFVIENGIEHKMSYTYFVDQARKIIIWNKPMTKII